MYQSANGGQATEENGALLKSYNHQWLERTDKATREKINRQLREFKLQVVGMEISGDLRVGNQIQFDFDNLGELLEIPLLRNEKEIER